MFKAQTDVLELKIHAHNSNSASVSSLDYLNIFAPDLILSFSAWILQDTVMELMEIGRMKCFKLTAKR